MLRLVGSSFARLASHARLNTEAFHLSLSKQNFAPRHVPSSKSTLRHPRWSRATKFKTRKFNSGGLFQLFTKISTHKITCYMVHVPGHVFNMRQLFRVHDTAYTCETMVCSYFHGNTWKAMWHKSICFVQL